MPIKSRLFRRATAQTRALMVAPYCAHDFDEAHAHSSCHTELGPLKAGERGTLRCDWITSKVNGIVQDKDKMKIRNLSFYLIAVTFLSATAFAQSSVVVFWEPGFPTADSAPIPDSLLRSALPNAQLVSAADLKAQLSSAQLLVLPYGSAFPEDDWAQIQGFLQRGGNLLVLGGRPFTRAAYRDGTTWQLRDYSVRYTRLMMIDQYQDTPGSDGLKFESNPDIPLSLASFAWKRGFSPIIHLS